MFLERILVTDHIFYCTGSISQAAVPAAIITISLLSLGLLAVCQNRHYNALEAEYAKQADIEFRLLLSEIDRGHKDLLNTISASIQSSYKELRADISTALQSSMLAERSEE